MTTIQFKNLQIQRLPLIVFLEHIVYNPANVIPHFCGLITSC